MTDEFTFDLPERIGDTIKGFESLLSNLPARLPEKITTENFHDVDGWLAEFKSIAKQAKDARLAITRPIDAAKKNITEQFDKVTDPLDELIEGLEAGVRIFLAAEAKKAETAANRERGKMEKKRARLVERAREAEAKGDHDRAAAYLEEAEGLVEYVPERLKSAAVRATENWQFRVTHPDKLPRELLVPDTKEIGKRVKALKADHGIPGVNAWDANSVDVLKKARGRRKK